MKPLEQIVGADSGTCVVVEQQVEAFEVAFRVGNVVIVLDVHGDAAEYGEHKAELHRLCSIYATLNLHILQNLLFEVQPTEEEMPALLKSGLIPRADGPRHGDAMLPAGEIPIVSQLHPNQGTLLYTDVPPGNRMQVTDIPSDIQILSGDFYRF